MSEETKKTRSKKYEVETKKPKIEEPEEVEETKSHPFLMKTLLIIGLLFILFCIYSFIICPNQLKVKEYKVESTILPQSFHGLKIVQFSDLHYGTSINKKQLDKIVKRINELKPDLIFFTGDLIDKNILPTEDIQNEVISSLSNLQASLYKYAVIGNEDEKELFDEIMTKIDFIVLNNESKLLYYKGNTPIEIIGFNNLSSEPDYSIINNPIDEIETTDYYKIVLFHESNAIDNVIDYNPNLILTSGTLGGKINITKPLFLPDTANKYYEDYYNINDIDCFISSGLGTTGINLRFNNKPSFNFYRLYKEEN